MSTPGHDPGQATSGKAAPEQAGLSWDGYLSRLIEQRGSLAAVAQHLAAQRGYQDDINNVERGLRRLRKRGQRDGGVWGRRLLAVFGLPSDIQERIRWMGQYHSRLSDLPASVVRDLLLPFDRPPVSESPARIWIHLGLASLALRARDTPRALEHLAQALLAAPGQPPAARAELELVRAYAVGRTDEALSVACLDSAEAILAEQELSEDDHACLHARLVDQRAYRLNKPRNQKPDHRAALALYSTISETGPPFARCRRHNGMSWSQLLLKRHQQALQHARASVSVAGDSGSLRMRAMALNLLSAVLDASGDDEGADQARERSRDIAARLEDEALRVRYQRPEPTT